MSPLPRILWTGSEISDNTGWYADTFGCFRERYYNERGPSPFVKPEGDHEYVVWDLGYGGRVPHKGEMQGVTCLVLAEGGNWVELRDTFVRFGWADYPHRGLASGFAAIDTLEEFRVEVMTDPEQVQLVIQAQIAPQIPLGTGAPGGLGGISVSIVFGREHQPALDDLCAFVEQTCGRRLQRLDSPPSAGPAMTGAAGQAGPDAGAHQPPPHDPAPVPDGEAPPRDAAATQAPGDDPRAAAPISPAEQHTRPPVHTLAATVDRAPDTAEWLSFAAPTTIELLSAPVPDADAIPPGTAATVHGHETPADWAS